MELHKVKILTPFIYELQELEKQQYEKEKLVQSCRVNLEDAEYSLNLVKQRIISVKVQIEEI